MIFHKRGLIHEGYIYIPNNFSSYKPITQINFKDRATNKVYDIELSESDVTIKNYFFKIIVSNFTDSSIIPDGEYEYELISSDNLYTKEVVSTGLIKFYHVTVQDDVYNDKRKYVVYDATDKIN